jgi:hypothetical protein
MLPWQEEGVPALIADPKQGLFASTPLSKADQSVIRRKADLVLHEDGTLEGDARIEYGGHAGGDLEEYDLGASAAEQVDSIQKHFAARFKTAELTKLVIEDVAPGKAPAYSFHIRVPGYAQKTGSRLFVSPAFFQRGVAAELTASERRHDLYFAYPWSEEDAVSIKLPPGFELESPGRPAPLRAPEVADYDLALSVTGKNERILCNRRFAFHALSFPKASYAPLKKLFDTVHERDQHSLALKRAN